jgi:uncharacterized phiE125 gp8 family phage protein
MSVHKLITPPSEQPVILADLVSVHIKVDDTSEEASLINEYIKAATELVEDLIQRQLMQATWELQMSDWLELDCDGYLRLLKAPLVSVTSVKYYDAAGTDTTLATSEYQVDTASLPGRIRFIGEKPETFDRPDAIRILYVAGYGAAGANAAAQRTAISDYRASRAKIGILRAVADFYEHRQDESPSTVYQLSESTKSWLNPLRLYL